MSIDIVGVLTNILDTAWTAGRMCPRAFIPTTKIIKPSIDLQFSTFKSANSICGHIVFLFPWPFLTLHERTALFFPHPCIQKLHPVSQAVFTCALNTLSTHTPPPLSLPSLCLIPSLVCGMPTSRGCPPVLGWHRLQGPGHIWSLREGEAHRALRARGKLETLMNRTIAGGRTDTKGPFEQRMCPSKLLMK